MREVKSTGIATSPDQDLHLLVARRKRSGSGRRVTSLQPRDTAVKNESIPVWFLESAAPTYQHYQLSGRAGFDLARPRRRRSRHYLGPEKRLCLWKNLYRSHPLQLETDLCHGRPHAEIQPGQTTMIWDLPEFQGKITILIKGRFPELSSTNSPWMNVPNHYCSLPPRENMEYQGHCSSNNICVRVEHMSLIGLENMPLGEQIFTAHFMGSGLW